MIISGIIFCQGRQKTQVILCVLTSILGVPDGKTATEKRDFDLLSDYYIVCIALKISSCMAWMERPISLPAF